MFRFNPILFIIGFITLFIGATYLVAGAFITELLFKDDVRSYEGVVVSYGYYLTPTDDKTYTHDLVVDIGGSTVDVQFVSVIIQDFEDGQKVTVYELKDYRSLDSKQVFDNPQNHITGRIITIFGIGILLASVFRSRKYNWLKDFAS